MSKTQNIHFKIEPIDKAKIVEAAGLTERSLSNYCTFVLLKISEVIKYGGAVELEKLIKQNGKKK